MVFTYKTEAELSAMTPEQRDIYGQQKREFEGKATQKMIDDALEAFKTANPAAAAPELPISKEEVAEMKETIAQLKEAQSGGPGKTTTMASEVKANKDALKQTLKSDGTEVVLKADTTRSSIANNYWRVGLPGIGQLDRVARALYDVFRKVMLPAGSHNGKISYVDWDADTTAKAAAMVAEGGTFPESTATFETFDISLKKVGDTLPVTEEFFEDEALAAAELERFIGANVESKIDDQIANGPGTGDNIKGLLASVDEYTPSASGIVDANIYDLITKVKGAITSAAGSKYNPNFTAMNNSTINRLLLKKDDNNNYQFPPSHPIFREIVEDNSLADNVLVVGDSRFGTIYEMGGVTISRGMVNTQFVKDMLTLKARKRLLFLIRNSDKSGFRKVSDISTALTTLAS